MNAVVNRLDQLARERDDLTIELLRSRQMLLGFKEMGKFLKPTIPNPTNPKFKEIRVPNRNGNWWKKINKAEDLIISGLKNVSSGGEAARARLIKRKHLETLTLRWEWHLGWEWQFQRDGRPRGVDDEVLENLQPHANLKKLIIRHHCGSKFPSWMENQWLSKLETIELYCCLTWLFTPLGKLPFLKYLNIVGPVGRLERLQSDGTQGWEEGREGEEDSQLFPNLRVLRISDCHKLTRLPLLPPTLTELYIRRIINLTALPGLWGCDGRTQGSACMRFLRVSPPESGALEIMTVDDCPRLETFPDDGLRLFVSLELLAIKDCGKLTWSPDHGGCLPASLVVLEIIRCPGVYVDSFFMGATNLTSLVIDSGPYNLPGELLCHLTALTKLEIRSCPKLQTLDFMALASLSQLKIFRCPDLHRPHSEGWGPSPLVELTVEWSNLRFLTHAVLQNLTSLKILYIKSFLTHEYLPDGLERLSKLKELYITNYNDITSLPEKGFPASLDILIFSGRLRMPVKLYLPKIAHIPYVEIDEFQIETEAWKQLTLEGA